MYPPNRKSIKARDYTNKDISGYASLTNSSVISANEILNSIQTDMLDVQQIVRKRNSHNHNLEELVALVKNENEDLNV